MQLLHLGIEALLVKVPGGDGGLNQGAVVGERILRILHIHADLRVQLLQPQFRLAILDERSRLIGLRGAVADGNAQIEADDLIGSGAVK